MTVPSVSAARTARIVGDLGAGRPAYRLLSDALDSGRLGPVRRLVNILSPAEIGNLLESLPAAKRNIVWGLVDPEDDGEVLVGDLVLAAETVVREATEKGWSVADYVGHLVVHGTLHLLGYDHETGDWDAEQMEALERAACARLHLPDPYEEDQ